MMTCSNCGLSDEACRGTVEAFWTDDGLKIPLCEECAIEERRVELLADELAASHPECRMRAFVVEGCRATRELVHRLQAHTLQCPTCSGVVEWPAEMRFAA